MKINQVGPWSDKSVSGRNFRQDEIEGIKDSIKREQERNPDGVVQNASIKEALKKKRLENKKRKEQHG